MQTVKCDDCGIEYTFGDSPFCSHGHTRGIATLDLLTPYWDEHLTPDGVMITSSTQRRKLMDKAGYEFQKNDHQGKVGDSRPMYFDRKV